MMQSKRQSVYLGLGSNLRNPCNQLKKALSLLSQEPYLKIISISSFYGSKPDGPIQDQPDFVNAVAHIETELSPEALLDCVNAIEHLQGRERTVRWGPRSLDIDILLYGEQTYQSDRLIIPHPRLQERAFVVFPLLEIAPHLQLPTGEELSVCARLLNSTSLWKIEEVINAS